MTGVNDLIEINGTAPLARGGHRVVYPYPGRPHWCVKIEAPTAEREARNSRGVWRRLRPHWSGEDGENRREYAAYRELQRQNVPEIWRHMPRCEGWVSTDQGRGLALEWITGPDGAPARSFAARIRTKFDAMSRRALDEIERWLLKHRIPVGDLHPSNLVFGTGIDGGDERLYVIDGLGARDLLWRPCFRVFRPLKIQRKIRRMEFRIQSLLCKTASLLWLGLLEDLGALASVLA